jgi:hypothetical protein
MAESTTGVRTWTDDMSGRNCDGRVAVLGWPVHVELNVEIFVLNVHAISKCVRAACVIAFRLVRARVQYPASGRQCEFLKCITVTTAWTHGM